VPARTSFINGEKACHKGLPSQAAAQSMTSSTLPNAQKNWRQTANVSQRLLVAYWRGTGCATDQRRAARAHGIQQLPESRESVRNIAKRPELRTDAALIVRYCLLVRRPEQAGQSTVVGSLR
jgi:hypothetical protein